MVYVLIFSWWLVADCFWFDWRHSL